MIFRLPFFDFSSKWCSDIRFGGMLSSILPKICSLLVFMFRTYLFSPNYVTVLQRITFFPGICVCVCVYVMLLLRLAFKSGWDPFFFFIVFFYFSFWIQWMHAIECQGGIKENSEMREKIEHLKWTCGGDKVQCKAKRR